MRTLLLVILAAWFCVVLVGGTVDSTVDGTKGGTTSVGLIDYASLSPAIPTKQCVWTYNQTLSFRETVDAHCAGMAALPLTQDQAHHMSWAPTRLWPMAQWIPFTPSFLVAKGVGHTSATFVPLSDGTLFLLGRWLPHNQGSVRVDPIPFFAQGSGLFELRVKAAEMEDGPLTITWSIKGHVDTTKGSGFEETFQTAAWFVPKRQEESLHKVSMVNRKVSMADPGLHRALVPFVSFSFNASSSLSPLVTPPRQPFVVLPSFFTATNFFKFPNL